ncbi:putative ATP-dependent RNA helicase BoYb [Scaptodrosophila lebanonensis]|uniref:RNA helicase n=1 Tax=Drosophila lebanonensis TaxID=7225 RepID=A0A6J2TRD5_DROLE|nr:putative ATP-dependent RNA helicase BoYb [Scaptodrosophila lebanonensis]
MSKTSVALSDKRSMMWKNDNVDHFNSKPVIAFDLERPLTSLKISDFAVAYSQHDVRPARHMSDVRLLPGIMQNMNDLDFTQLLRLQSYAWPHLIGGIDNGAIITSAPCSGRSMCYIPPLCQAVVTSMTEIASPWVGPLALAVVPGLQRVAKVASQCCSLLNKMPMPNPFSTIILTVPSAYEDNFFQRLWNGVGCLICTPNQYLWLLHNYGEVIQFRRLSFVALDDVDLIDSSQLEQVYSHLLETTRTCRPQMVMTSQSYLPTMLPKLLAFNDHPMLLFGDELEAALYGGARIKICMVKSESKPKEVLRILKERQPNRMRTVVFCNIDSETKKLVSELERNSYKCIPYYLDISLNTLELMKDWIENTRGAVLICTGCCPDINLRGVHTIIHYEVSESYSMFKERHLLFLHNCKNPLYPFKSKTSGLSLQSVVLLDESNNEQLPRLVDFMRRHKYTLDECVVQLSNRIQNEKQRKKDNEPALCTHLMTHGVCDNVQCEWRHELREYDNLPANLPNDGDIKVDIVRVYSPVHFCVRLLEHLPQDGTWKEQKHLYNMGKMELRLQIHFSNLENQQCFWPPQAKKICILHSPNGFERVRILNVASIKHINLACTDLEVQVQALDVDRRIVSTTSGQLYVCPPDLINLPPLAIDLRLVGLVPETNELSFFEKDGYIVRDWLNNLTMEHFMQAKIVFALSHTIFVRTIKAMTYAPAMKVHIDILNVRQRLLNERLVKYSPQTETMLLDFLVGQIDEVENGSSSSETFYDFDDASFDEQQEIGSHKRTEKSEPFADLIEQTPQQIDTSTNSSKLSRQKTAEPASPLNKLQHRLKQEYGRLQQNSVGGEEIPSAEMAAKGEQLKQITGEEDIICEHQKDKSEQKASLVESIEAVVDETLNEFSDKSEQSFGSDNNNLNQPDKINGRKIKTNSEPSPDIIKWNHQQIDTSHQKTTVRAEPLNILQTILQKAYGRSQQTSLGGEEIQSPEMAAKAEQNEEDDQLDMYEEKANVLEFFEAVVNGMSKKLGDYNNNLHQQQKRTVRKSKISTEQLHRKLKSKKHAKTLHTLDYFPRPEKLPPGCGYPEVFYYQTRKTLELQVLLPEDKIRYTCTLQTCGKICFSTMDYEPKKLSFAISTECVGHFSKLDHHMKGRTVYMSVHKSMIITYPLPFKYYKFMKPGFGHLDNDVVRWKDHNNPFQLYLEPEYIHRQQSGDDFESDTEEWLDPTIETAKEYFDGDV